MIGLEIKKYDSSRFLMKPPGFELFWEKEELNVEWIDFLKSFNVSILTFTIAVRKCFGPTRRMARFKSRLETKIIFHFVFSTCLICTIEIV